LAGVDETLVTILYLIKDFNDNIIFSVEESILIAGQKSISKKLRIPSGIATGEYVIVAEVRYEKSVGTSSEAFKVTAKASLARIYTPHILVVIVILVSLISFVVYKLSHQQVKSIKKESRKLMGSRKSFMKKVIETSMKVQGETDSLKTKEGFTRLYLFMMLMPTLLYIF